MCVQTEAATATRSLQESSNFKCVIHLGVTAVWRGSTYKIIFLTKFDILNAWYNRKQVFFTTISLFVRISTGAELSYVLQMQNKSISNKLVPGLSSGTYDSIEQNRERKCKQTKL